MLTRKTWVAAVFLASITLVAQAAVYVVDGRDSRSSDDNPGSLDKPFKTINKAAQVVLPGDTVTVKQGVYREHVRLTRSGTSASPVVFAADPPGSVVVTGADIIPDWRRAEGDAPIWRVEWAHRFFVNRRSDGSFVEHYPDDDQHRLWGRAEQVIVDGKPLMPALALDDLRKSWEEHRRAREAGRQSPGLQPPLPNLGGPFGGAFCADTQNHALYLWLADGSDPNAHQVEAGTRGTLFGVNPWANPKGVHNVHVRGFIFRYGATFPQRPAVWLHGKENLMENCVVEAMAGCGALVNGVMRRCSILRCGHTGGGASGENFLNEECLWEGNSWKPVSRGWDAGGFKMAWCNGGVFRRCGFRRNGGPGLWLDVHVRNVLITECVFWENEHTGLFIEISRDIAVLRNLFVRNGIGAVGQVKWPDWGIAGLLIAESQNCVATFNTLVGNKDGIAFREQGPRRLRTEDFGEVPYHNSGNVVFGNVSAFNRGYQLALWYDNGFFGPHPSEQEKFKTESEYEEFLKKTPDAVFDPAKVGMTIDRNVYFADKGQKLILYGAPWRAKHRKYDDLSSFADATGFDARSAVADPKFAGLEAGDFGFQPESPAREMEAGWLRPPPDAEKWMSSLASTNTPPSPEKLPAHTDPTAESGPE